MPYKRISKSIVKINLINLYLDKSTQNTIKKKRLKFLFYLLSFDYIITICKYLLTLFFDFSYETNLLLYDLSILLGGIPKFNRIFIICIFVFGLSLCVRFHLANNQQINAITETFDLIDGRRKVLYDYKDIEIIDKLNKLSKITYKLFYTSVLTFGESLLSISDYHYNKT